MTLQHDDYETYFDKLNWEVQQFRHSIDNEFQQYELNGTNFNEYKQALTPIIGHEIEQFQDEIYRLRDYYREIRLTFSSRQKANTRPKRFVYSLYKFMHRLQKADRQLDRHLSIIGHIPSNIRNLTTSDSTEHRVHALINIFQHVTNLTQRSRVTTTRHKRAILGFLGPILSTIFGVANEDQLVNMRSNIESLRRRGDHLSMALGKTLMVVNDTRTYVAINRENLNKLSEGVRVTRQIFRAAINDLRLDMSSEFRFNHFITRLHSLFHLSTSVLNRIALNIHSLKQDLDLAWTGRLSPSLVNSRQFKKLLNNVRKNIDKSYRLPFTTRRLSEYYKSLPVVMAYNDNTIHLAMIIPLVKTGDRFDLFKAFAIPESSTDGLHYWKIESNYIAMSEDRKNYLYLSPDEFETCKLGFCSLHTPIYNVQDTSSCVIAAFTKNEDAIDKNCNYVLEPFPTSVIVEHISGPVWLVLSRKNWSLTVICHDPRSSSIVDVTDKVFVLRVNDTCEATGRYFNIPRRVNYQSQNNIDRVNSISIIKFDHWNISGPTFKMPELLYIDNTDLPDKTARIDNDPDLDRAFQEIDYSDTISWYDMPIDNSHRVIVLVCILAALVLFGVALFFVLRWYLLKRVLIYRRNKTNTPHTDSDEKACEALYVNAVNIDKTDKTSHSDSDVETPITAACDCE